MSKFKNVMLDIETMGNTNRASIMAIGACYFDPMTGDIGPTFHKQVDISSNGVIDASTVLWWMKQSDDARSKFYNNDKAGNISDVLKEFSSFIIKGACVWGNGIGFDNVIVGSAYDDRGLRKPWDFWNERDVRTAVALGQAIGLDPKRDMPFDGVKHDALADAIHQAKYVSLIWSTIVTLGGAA